MNIMQHEFAVYLLFLSCVSPEFSFGVLLAWSSPSINSSKMLLRAACKHVGADCRCMNEKCAQCCQNEGAAMNELVAHHMRRNGGGIIALF